MASADNLMAMDSVWMFGNQFPETWFAETFSRETETLTKALQKSFETTQYFDNINFSTQFVSPCYFNNNNNNSNNTSDTTTTISGEYNSASTTTVAVTSRKRSIGGGGKIVKRKSRASKRAATTYINADVTNFRQLVQEVTGVRFGGGGGEVEKPEHLRGVNRMQMIAGGGGGGLPTLDTSAFLLDPSRRDSEQVVAGGGAPPEEVVLDGGAAASHSQFDFDSFCSFPTLESWKGI